MSGAAVTRVSLVVPESLEDVAMAVNYGLDRVRRPAPVPWAVAATATIVEVTPLEGGGCRC